MGREESPKLETARARSAEETCGVPSKLATARTTGAGCGIRKGLARVEPRIAAVTRSRADWGDSLTEAIERKLGDVKPGNTVELDGAVDATTVWFFPRGSKVAGPS